MSDLTNAPAEVLAAHNTLVANALEAEGGDEDWAYTHKAHQCYPGHVPENEWMVGSNFEDGSSIMIYKVDEGKWYYRRPWDGEDSPMPGGFQEALSNASIWFTG